MLLRWYRDNGQAVIEVQDSGIGIPAEYQSRVFERFYRVDKARSRELGGTGLGLSVSLGIVQRHGGEMLVESEEGKGTRFAVRLPLVRSRMPSMVKVGL